MDNNKESILHLVRLSGKDIISFLAKKYDLLRTEVKQHVFVYAYSGSLISNPDSLKFVEPETKYQKLVNDYIDYSKECAKLTMHELITQRKKYERMEYIFSEVAMTKEDIDRLDENVRHINATLKELFDDGKVIKDTIEI